MQNIPIKLAKAGMVLAKDVMPPANASGMPICGKETELSDKLIERLEAMGVESVIVEGHPVVIEGEGTLEEMLEKLEKRFCRVNDDPLMVKVKEIYRSMLIRSMGE